MAGSILSQGKDLQPTYLDPAQNPDIRYGQFLYVSLVGILTMEGGETPSPKGPGPAALCRELCARLQSAHARILAGVGCMERKRTGSH